MTCISVGHHTAIALLKQTCHAGQLLVDVGAFPGTLTRLLVENGWRVIALDKDPERGITLQQRFKEGHSVHDDMLHEVTFAQDMQRIGVQALQADIECTAIPLNSGLADAAVLTEVIEHLYVDPLFALSEVNRVVKPGGTLLISTPNLLSIRNRFNFLLGRMDRVIEPPFLAFLKKSKLGHVGHVRLYAPSELGTILRLLGFEPTFHFFSFDYWDAAPTQANATTPPSSKHSSIFRKLIRSPRSYFNASLATLCTLLEAWIPRYRPHTFVIARKVRDVDYERLSVADFDLAVK